MGDVKRCAACGKENPVSEMKVCMHQQMHRYVCDSKCMTDFYNQPKKPTAAELEAKVATLKAELAKLRQQLAERDTTIERLESGIPRLQEHAYQMRHQRDKLAGLLADVKADYTHAIHWEDMHAIMKRIDAALAEVNK